MMTFWLSIGQALAWSEFWLAFWSAFLKMPAPVPRRSATITNLAQWRTDHPDDNGRAA